MAEQAEEKVCICWSSIQALMPKMNVAWDRSMPKFALGEEGGNAGEQIRRYCP